MKEWVFILFFPPFLALRRFLTITKLLRCIYGGFLYVTQRSLMHFSRNLSCFRIHLSLSSESFSLPICIFILEHVEISSSVSFLVRSMTIFFFVWCRIFVGSLSRFDFLAAKTHSHQSAHRQRRFAYNSQYPERHLSARSFFFLPPPLNDDTVPFLI